MSKKKEKRISVRIPPVVNDLIQVLIEKGVYLDKSGFIREALRIHASTRIEEYWKLIGLVEESRKEGK